MNHSDKTLRFGSARELQNYFLHGVSRTFALTIPALPEDLFPAVANGYLLCRIIDCIEDDPGLDLQQKKFFASQFVGVVEGKEDATDFSTALLPALSDATSPAEKELIEYTADVIRITHAFNPQQRQALFTCVQIMGEGMMYYQQQDTSHGLQDMAEVERYCYYVAGVVGEMLTRLYAEYSVEIREKQDILLKLSVCFGQGLQMTNIIKDIWTDLQRGVCWLPRAEFAEHGFALDELAHGNQTPSFVAGLEDFIGIAHWRLQQALDYTLMIPSHETGVRNFCLFAIGMAILTLGKINKNKAFLQGENVKITRNTVRLVVFASRLFGRSNLALRILFKLASWRVPVNRDNVSAKAE